MHSVLLVVLSDIRYLIFLSQLLEEVLVVSSPLSNGKLSYRELCVGLNSVDTCAGVALLALDRFNRPLKALVPGQHPIGLLSLHHAL